MAAKPKDLPKDYIIRGVEVMEEKILGEGAYGVVKLGMYYGLLCAVKKLKATMFPPGMKQMDQMSELVLQSFYNECETLSRIRHPNVVQFLGAYQDKHTHLPVIVMELMHESLSRLLFRTKTLPLYVEVNITHDIVQALAYLHSFKPPIVHRDLSSNNIMISQEYRAKITDLGVAKVAKGSFLNLDNTPAPGTLSYMPPEVRKFPADLSPAMDIFAVGVNIIQIAIHKFPKPGPEFVSGVLGFSRAIPEKERRKEQIAEIRRSHPLKALALECLRDGPKDRPSALKLCERLEVIKGAKEYLDSLEIGQTKDDTKEDAMEIASELEHRVEQLKQELLDKTAELERAKQEIHRERKYTAQLLEERAREQIEYGKSELEASGPQAEPESPPNERKKKKTPGFKFKITRRRSSKASTLQAVKDSPPEAEPSKREKSKDKSKPKEEEPAPPVAPDNPPPPEVEEQTLIPNGVPEDSSSSRDFESYLEVTDTLFRESAAEMVKRNYKVNKLTWFSHKSLLAGLQGTTLRLHQCRNKLYLCGGVSETGAPNKAIYFCPVKNLTRWVRLPPDAPQYYCASAIIQDELVLIGGINSSDEKCTNTLISYDHKAQVWVKRLPPIPTPRSSAAAFVCGDYLIVIGGQNDEGEALGLIEVLHIPTRTWEMAVRFPEKIAGQSVAVSGDTVYLVGGSNGPNCLRSVYTASVRKIVASCRHFSLFSSVDRSSKVWKKLADCPFTKMVATFNGDQLLALGGNEVTKASTHAAEWIWLYEAEMNVWTPVQSMPSARQLCCVTFLEDASLIVAGGDPDFTRIDIAEFV